MQLTPPRWILALALLALAMLVPRSAICQVQTGSSSVGYIDNAIIGTQMRLRFDAAYDNNRPDRAEFFYAKCGCFREVGVDPDAPGPAPQLDGRDPNTTRFIETSVDYQDISAYFEYVAFPDFSVFIEAPLRFLDPEVNDNVSGLADIHLGFKWAILSAPCDSLTFQFRSYLPTGDAGRGLGTDHMSFEPALLYYGQIDQRLSLEAELRDWIPIDPSSGVPTEEDDFAGHILRYGVGLAYDIYECCHCGTRVTPVVEVVGWTVLDGLASSSRDGTLSTFTLEDAEGDTIANIKLGIRVASRCDSLYVGYGRALTDEWWYEEIVRLEYRRTF